MSMEQSAEFTSSIAAFSALLREQHGFGVGHGATHDALRAADVVGITNGARLRSAFRLVYCATADEAARFDAVFDAFFFGPRGIAQPNLTSRHTRPQRGAPRGPETSATPPRTRAAQPETDDARGAGVERRPVEGLNDTAVTWQTLRARYSANATRAAEPPVIPAAGLDAAAAAAHRLVSGVRIARSRRRIPRRNGPRVDLRRTLRASVPTGGDPIVLHCTGPALRSARFVVLIDGSRSMAENAGPMLQFAYALCRRTRRAHAFVFSTALRDVTGELREPGREGHALRDLGEAWGGGTRIGANLDAFVQSHGGRLLSAETIVFIFSDGLDVGNLAQLERAMRVLHSRTAAVVWLNPHAGSPGFIPSTGGMRVALPYVTLLAPAANTRDLDDLARTLSRRFT
jgi:uncharacterized protein